MISGRKSRPNPNGWFQCKFCKKCIQGAYAFKDHKQEFHSEEYQDDDSSSLASYRTERTQRPGPKSKKMETQRQSDTSKSPASTAPEASAVSPFANPCGKRSHMPEKQKSEEMDAEKAQVIVVNNTGQIGVESLAEKTADRSNDFKNIRVSFSSGDSELKNARDASKLEASGKTTERVMEGLQSPDSSQVDTQEPILPDTSTPGIMLASNVATTANSAVESIFNEEVSSTSLPGDVVDSDQVSQSSVSSCRSDASIGSQSRKSVVGKVLPMVRGSTNVEKLEEGLISEQLKASDKGGFETSVKSRRDAFSTSANFARDEPGVQVSSSERDITSVDEKTGTSNSSYHDVREEAASSSANASFNELMSFKLRRSSGSAVVEDEIDRQLAAQDGSNYYMRDPEWCRHSKLGRCEFCLPVEPYDENYLREHNIKHLSFHSYLRKLMAADEGEFTPLESISLRIKEGCLGHPPWPLGICSQCQPPTVTLSRQLYRHVDEVLFENPNITDRFLSYWRVSGHQRVGLLYGRYEEHNEVPLGIRARVAAIYEPPQETSRDAVKFSLDESQLPIVNEIASALGLRCVGWVLTDLLLEDQEKGTVKNVRGKDSSRLSAQECINTAHFQTKFPNPCKQANSGTFGSKFATVLITGDDTNQIRMSGFQVSNQCMSLVKDKCLVPTKDAPELAYVKESSEKQYIPDVVYKEKDECGNEEIRMARPFSVECLLVDVPVSTSVEPRFTFAVPVDTNPFPVENRQLNGKIQDFTALAAYLNQFPRNTPFLTMASDFHFLIYIATMDVYPLRDYIGPLLGAITSGDAEAADDWAASEHWLTVKSIVEACTTSAGHIEGVQGSNAAVKAGVNGRSDLFGPTFGPVWVCSHCTFINTGNPSNCDMCTRSMEKTVLTDNTTRINYQQNIANEKINENITLANLADDHSEESGTCKQGILKKVIQHARTSEDNHLSISKSFPEDAEKDSPPVKNIRQTIRVGKSTISRKFKCPLCELSFGSLHERKLHKKEVHDISISYTCNICHETFRLERCFLRHKLSHLTYSCKDCARKFDGKAEYDAHMQVHEKKKSPKTVKASQATKRKTNVSNDIAHDDESSSSSSSDEGDRTNKFSYRCRECGTTWDSRTALIEHKKAEHGSGSWSMCPTPSESPDDHNVTTPPGKKTRKSTDNVFSKQSDGLFHCSICDQTFERLDRMKYHFYNHTGERPYECRYCKKGFLEKILRVYHENTHLGIKPFVCDLCPAAFFAPSSRHYHRKQHPNAPKIPTARPANLSKSKGSMAKAKGTRIKKLIPTASTKRCKFCGKVFSTSGLLKWHENTHTNTKPYKCQLCPVSFCNPMSRIQHEVRVHGYKHGRRARHGEGLQPSKQPRQVAKPSASKEDRRKLVHSNSASGSRSGKNDGEATNAPKTDGSQKKQKKEQTQVYHCEYCSKTYGNRVALKYHTFTHTGEKPFKCKFCGMSCSMPAELARHVKAKHPTLSVTSSRNVLKKFQSGACLSVSRSTQERLRHRQLAANVLHSLPNSSSATVVNTDSNTKLDVKSRKGAKSRRFNCHLCHRDYTVRAHLIRHLNVTHKYHGSVSTQSHQSLNQPKFSCSVCNKKFSNDGERSRHQQLCKYFSESTVAEAQRNEQELGNTARNSSTSSSLPNSDNSLNCRFCSKKFSNQTILTYHENIHLNLKPFECRSCSESFSYPASRRKHEKKCQSDQKSKKSSSVDQIVSSCPIKAERKNQDVSAKKPWQCKFCHKTCSSAQRLQTHENIHTNARPFKCRYCAKGFNSSSNRSSHERRLHEAEVMQTKKHQSPPTLLKPAKVAASKTKPKKKLKTYSPATPVEPNKVHQCWFCQSSFVDPNDLCSHLTLVHPCNTTVASPAKAKTAKVRFALGKRAPTTPTGITKVLKKSILKSPNIASSVQRKAQLLTPCTICGKIFKNLASHMKKTHNDAIKYPCQLCPQILDTLQALQDHTISAHTDAKAFGCHICGDRFGSLRDLQYHTINHANASSQQKLQATRSASRSPTTAKTSINFLCSECDKSFDTELRLADHFKSAHTKEKPSQCSKCAQKFASQVQYLRHVALNTCTAQRSPRKKTETVSFYYKCESCNCEFTQRVLAEAHQKWHAEGH